VDLRGDAVTVRNGVTIRGTSNGNQRGSSESRRRRREWLLETYAADVALTRVEWDDGEVDYRGDFMPLAWWESQIGKRPVLIHGVVVSVTAVATCRCYRCGTLLHDGTLTVDRIIPGCHGGTYRRTNIRPACGGCNSETGAPLRKKPVRARPTAGRSRVTSAPEG
jgi:5-methylcytosine-specific restriction endonuclease McrA